MYAERRPQGFPFSDTAFRIFVLMASRRLNSDRFFTTDYTAEVYTQAGLDWIDTNTMSSVLRRHYLGISSPMRSVDNASTPGSGPHAERRDKHTQALQQRSSKGTVPGRSEAHPETEDRPGQQPAPTPADLNPAAWLRNGHIYGRVDPFRAAGRWNDNYSIFVVSSPPDRDWEGRGS